MSSQETKEAKEEASMAQASKPNPKRKRPRVDAGLTPEQSLSTEMREISSVMMTAGRFLSPCRDGKLILGRGGVLRHLLAWRHLDVLHVLLQVGEVDADVVKGEIAFENICNTILSLRHCQLCI